MNKSDLVSSMAEQSGLTKKDCFAALEGFIGSIQGALADGEEVVIAGFVKFTTKAKAAHTGRNPATGEEVDVPDRVQVKIRPGSKLIDMVNA